MVFVDLSVLHTKAGVTSLKRRVREDVKHREGKHNEEPKNENGEGGRDDVSGRAEGNLNYKTLTSLILRREQIVSSRKVSIRVRTTVPQIIQRRLRRMQREQHASEEEDTQRQSMSYSMKM